MKVISNGVTQMINMSNTSYKTYKSNLSHRTYVTYVVLFVLFFSFFLQSVPPARAGILSRPPTNLGLVGYWPMDEGVGSKTGDFSGSRNTGTITGATWSAGKHGNALSFDGGSFVSIPHSENLNISNSLSISAWVNLNEITNRGIIEKTINGVVNTQYLLFAEGNRFKFRIIKSGMNTIASDTDILPNLWYYVSATYDGMTMRIYINGILQAETLSVVAPINTGNGQTFIGSLGDNIYRMNGRVDDVRIYNRALTASEISKLYSSGQTTLKKVSEQGLVGYWPMNEGQGSKVGDSSGKNNIGSITGATWTDGKKGKALSFDGNDYINAGTSETLNTTGDFSASLWFKTPGPGLNSWDALMSKSNVAYFVNAPNKGWHIISRNISGTNAINFQYSGASAAQQVSWTGGADNLWHHVVAVRQGNLFSIYIDSILKSSLTTAVGDISMPGESLFIGKGKFSDYFHGSLDDVRLYNRALSAAEIQSIYKQNETMANAPQNDELTNGLVALWSFNGKDVSGTTAYDRSGQNNNGTINGGAKPDAGKVGQAVSFDGVDDYLVSTSVVNVAKVTVSAWVKITSAPVQNGLVVGFINGLANAAHDKDLYIGTDRKPYFYIFDGATKTTSAPTSVIPLNTWVHIVGIADGTNAKTYLNGVEVGTVAAGNTYTSYTVPNVFVSGATGSVPFGGGYMKQQVDEVRIYNRALAPLEVQQLYNMGK